MLRSRMLVPAPAAPADDDITVRFARAADGPVLAGLAELEGAPVPPEPVLVAEQGGRIRVALPLEGGAALADPFYPASHLRALLSMRAAQIAGSSAPTRPGRTGLLRSPRALVRFFAV